MKTTGRANSNSIKSRRHSTKAKMRSAKAGLPPGSLVYVGEREKQKPSISVVEYDEARLTERVGSDVRELLPLDTHKGTCWIHLSGLAEPQDIEFLGAHFHVHPLVLEDILNTTQRPKVDYYDSYLYIVIRMLSYDEKTEEITSEQVSMIVGKNHLLTFSEHDGNRFEAVMERIRAGKGRIRKSGPDYLAYCLMDAVVDNYFSILEKMAERIEVLEEALVVDPNRQTLQTIHTLKTDMLYLRRSVWPLREVISRMARGDTELIANATLPYLRDVYDHAIHVIDSMETYRDIITGMLDIYLSSMSHRLNEIMKVLTIIATIFIPLTFMTGWYGMNFKNMPELQWPLSYPVFAAVSATAVIGMLIWFKIRKWL